MEDEKVPHRGPPGRSDLNSPEHWRLQRITNVRDEWKHACAAAAHGWIEHAYHEGQPMQLSGADYDAALVAAASGKVHEPAASKHLVRAGEKGGRK